MVGLGRTEEQETEIVMQMICNVKDGPDVTITLLQRPYRKFLSKQTLKNTNNCALTFTEIRKTSK